MRLFLNAVFCGVAFAAGLAAAQSTPNPAPPPPPPAGNTILLWPNGAPSAVGDTAEDKPRLAPFLVKGPGLHTAVIIAPGGGYSHEVYDREGTRIAQWLNAHGVSAFVLIYRLSPRYYYPVPLLDGKRAVRWVRSHAADYGVDPAKVGVMGFSSGGHLMGYVGTHFDAGDPSSADPVERTSSRPDFAIVAYGLFTMEVSVNGTGLLKGLTGDNRTDAVLHDLSSDLFVTAQTPPFFIFATTSDKTVNAMNSTHLYNALKTAGVPVELHIFEPGVHGVDLAQQYPALKVWPVLMDTWMQSHGWMPAEP